MDVADILKTKGATVISVQAAAPISEACKKLHQHRIGALVVVNAQSQVIGIFSERDIVRGLAERGADALSLKVEDLMSRRLYVCKPQDDIKSVMGWMTEHRVRHLPVIEGGQLHGLISIGDVVKYRLTEVQTEANVLRDIVLARH